MIGVQIKDGEIIKTPSFTGNISEIKYSTDVALFDSIVKASLKE